MRAFLLDKMPLYKTETEIVALQAATGDASIHLSDQRTAQFGSARRSDIIGWVADQNNDSQQRWHDGWEKFLRGQSINNSNYIEEERAVFHKTTGY